MSIRRGLLAQMTQGQGLKYASGTIVIETMTNTPPTVTHNLGTKKVIALWWAESGTVYASYNRIGYQSLINWWDIVPDDYKLYVNNDTEITFDKTRSIGQTELYCNISQINPLGGYSIAPNAFTITDDTLQLYGPYVKTWEPATYHWVVIALP